MKELKELYVKFLKDNKYLFILYSITLVYIPINSIYLPKLYGDLISNIKSKKFKGIEKLFLILICGWLAIQIMNTASSYIMNILMPKFKQYIRTFFITEIMDRYKTNFQQLKLGDMITKIIKSPYVLEDIFYMFKDVVVYNIITITSIFAYLLYYNINLGLIFGLCMIIIILLSVRYFTTCKDNIKNMEILYDKTHEEIEDTFSNLISIYTARKYKDETERISNIDDQLYDNVQSMNKCKNKYRIVFTFIFIITIIILNYLAYTLFMKKKMKLETFIAVFIINYSLLGIFMGFFRELNDLMHSSVNINLIIDYLNNQLPKRIKERFNKNNIPQLLDDNKKPIDGLKIEFKNVKFKYNKDSPYILNGINLKIEPNETILIQGHIGSGKSTLSKLLLKFITNYEGEILINDKSNENMNVDDLREKIMYIPQHPNLFNRTLRENLLYGVDNYTIDDILNKLKAIGLTDIYNKFKAIIDNKVGKLGSQLSGGQRQLVWILRSIFNNSKMVILDEPTSSLDEESKGKIMKLIKEISIKRNLIIITHDNDIKKYNLHNRIIIFNKGVIDKIVKHLIPITNP
jgi:ABC-type multidrug transport system fused ATPase/permease subunit